MNNESIRTHCELPVEFSGGQRNRQLPFVLWGVEGVSAEIIECENSVMWIFLDAIYDDVLLWLRMQKSECNWNEIIIIFNQ